MSVQFNLLPDVKLAYDKAQRSKRLVYAISSLVSVVVIVIFSFSFVVTNVLQKKMLTDSNNDITSYSNKLKSIPNLTKILTVQNQLKALPSIQDQKHYTSRLFTYLPQLTPSNIQIGDLTLDTGANTIDIVGTADTVESINKFVDTLKFTTYIATDGSGDKLPAFSDVLLTKVDRDQKDASYTIDASFDPALFTGSKSIKLTVPDEITSRSVLNTPDSTGQLFNGQTGKPPATTTTDTGSTTTTGGTQ